MIGARYPAGRGRGRAALWLRLVVVLVAAPLAALAPSQAGEDAVGLVDHTGRPIAETDWRGHFLLLYFGFTWCPDLCPTSLAVMADALDELGPAGERILPLFVTIDPERDGVAQVASYVANFHPRLVGVTGDQKAIGRLARRYQVAFAKHEIEGSGYVVDHVSKFILVGPGGEVVGSFPHGIRSDQLARAIAGALAAAEH